MLYLFIINLILFLPLIVSVYTYLNFKDKKLYFAIYIFKFIKIFSGYLCVRDKGGFYLHVFNKAYVINAKTFTDMINGPKLLRVIQPLSAYLNVESGLKSVELGTILTAVSCASNLIMPYIKNENTLFDFKYRLELHDDYNGVTSVMFFTKVCFNLFSIVKRLIADIIDKGVKHAKKRA